MQALEYRINWMFETKILCFNILPGIIMDDNFPFARHAAQATS